MPIATMTLKVMQTFPHSVDTVVRRVLTATLYLSQRRRYLQLKRRDGRKEEQTYYYYEEGAQGYRKYDVTASKVTDAEAKALAQQINNAIRRLEKAGIEDQSAEYLMMKHYAHQIIKSIISLPQVT